MTVTRDGFLGGRVTLAQPARGFRAGSDAVLLAAACPARPGETVLDLGCGVGAAMYCLGARVQGLRLTGVERDAEAARLARANGPAEVIEGSVLDLPPALRLGFDHVICNPPYFGATTAPAADPARAAALREAAPGDLARWIDVACRRAGPKGSVTFVARADRLADLLGAMAPRLGGLRVLPVAGRAGVEAGRVIVRGQKGARAPLSLLAPFVMHAGAAHESDRDSHTPQAQAVLRDGQALDLG
ncbi:tRNA1(Val) (adenine(37)-N6)-methyltransferase [Jannaschia ovalis]|uniref:Methyltransferase n=1 Tax=Jannaschia ovalis TaxID=3038773 RepID=A0ABY8LE28_9RHOB|nr:methyltransferase [Jannaschia sp. GRR-S6-38]WGH79564.1 methyltransferase [Jannaschia sp. GRR-S6-38]